MHQLPKWFIDKVIFAMECGFYQKVEGDIKEVAEIILEKSKGSYFGSLLELKEEELIHYLILSFDESKACLIESWMTLGQNFNTPEAYYTSVFHELKKISSGLFDPENITIRECGYCQGRDKRLDIEFYLNGEKIHLNFCIDLDVLILSFMEELNEKIAAKNISFQYHLNPYGPGFIFSLSGEEQKKLNANWNIKFDRHPEYWSDKAKFAMDHGSDPEVKDYFSKYFNLMPFDFVSYYEYAWYLHEKYDYHLALEHLEKGIGAIENNLGIENHAHPEEWLDLIKELKEKILKLISTRN